MTASKFDNRCPVCSCRSWCLQEHLDENHRVGNPAERRILLAYARGRVNVRGMRCPVQGCAYGGRRVPQHLQEAHRDLGPRQKRRLLTGLQWWRTLEKLRELRRSNPHMSLGTRLDLEEGRSALAVGMRPSRSSPPRRPAVVEDNDEEEEGEEDGSPPPSPDGAPQPPPPPSPPPPSPPRPAVPRFECEPVDLGIQQQAVVQEGSGGQSPSSTTPDPVRRPIKFPETVVRYMDGYKRHLVGALPSKKHIENVRSKMGRLTHFLNHMAEGKCGLDSWRFLDDADRVLGWPAELLKRGKQITTVKVYLVNTGQFLTYFQRLLQRAPRSPSTAWCPSHGP
ncbi:uncharacterized protein LOC129379935 isoform X1 [Poeciliopsis prolifica]|uniref:uncharacterized protein LOC129379935 isoform X1 n=1 Tax=Poeciliopsis prolifica TaxID=188132 RepID=UPI002414423F|nr:uncharacterized protein LOC129379935 isoform X1 [Poeciliopsis prolifica]